MEGKLARRRLGLSRETLRDLSDERLPLAGGGITTISNACPTPPEPLSLQLYRCLTFSDASCPSDQPCTC